MKMNENMAVTSNECTAMTLYNVKLTVNTYDCIIGMKASVLAPSDDKKAIKKLLKKHFKSVGADNYKHIRVRRVKPADMGKPAVVSIRP
jgi:hypothetical protein